MKPTTTIALLLCLMPIVVAFVQRERITPEQQFNTLKLECVKGAVESLEKLNTNIQQQQPVDELQRNYHLALSAFASAELFLEYVDADAIWKTINGAPLPKLDPKSNYLDVLQPSGFQALEEELFSDNPDYAQLQTLCSKLTADVNNVAAYTIRTPFTQRQIAESAQRSIIRMCALTITGFDTPSSKLSATKLKAQFNTLSNVVKVFAIDAPLDDVQTVTDLLSAGAVRVRAATDTTFDSFDRVEFIKNTLEPLYSMIVTIQEHKGVEFLDETTLLRTPVNTRSKHIFSTSLFDPLFYTNIAKSVDVKALAKVGQMLFVDPILSSNNKRSCASCHNPSYAFTDQLPTSTAIDSEHAVVRNAITLSNSIYASRYFYDLRANGIEDVVEHVVTDRAEFASSLSEVVAKINRSSEYKQLFASAYNRSSNTTITFGDVAQALSAYVASLSSFNSPVDQYLRGEIPSIPENAKRGFNLFAGKALCATCHFVPTFSGLVPPLFSDSESEVLGVGTTSDSTNNVVDTDVGRFGKRIKESAEFYRFSFKTVTVRNVALTAPYMHNGTFTSLREVVDFYNRGGGNGQGMNLEHQTLPFDELNLTDAERDDIVAFLELLTDTSHVLQNVTRLPRFNDPDLDSRTIGGEY